MVKHLLGNLVLRLKQPKKQWSSLGSPIPLSLDVGLGLCEHVLLANEERCVSTYLSTTTSSTILLVANEELNHRLMATKRNAAAIWIYQSVQAKTTYRHVPGAMCLDSSSRKQRSEII